MSEAEGKKASAQGSDYQENMTAPPLNEDDRIASDEGADDQDTIPQKADSVLSAIEKVSLLCSALPCKSNDGFWQLCKVVKAVCSSPKPT